MAVSWFGIIVLVVVLYMLVQGLANPRTRPFVGCLGVLVGLVVFLAFFWLRAVRVPEQMRAIERVQAEQTDRMMHEQSQRIIASSPTPSPAKDSGHAQSNRPKTTLIAALRKAVVYALTTNDPVPIDEPTPKLVAANPPMVPERPVLPVWVDYTEPRMQNGVYEMSVLAGPFTTQLECERELPKAVQRAVSEYADLSVGPEAAKITLPDDVLKGLVQARVTDARQMEIDGSSREMYSLHALVVFDTDLQQRLKSEAQRPVIGRRVKIAAMIFGGLFGLLTAAWIGLKWVTRRQQPAGVERAQGKAESAGGSFPGSVVLSAVVVTVVVVVLAAML